MVGSTTGACSEEGEAGAGEAAAIVPATSGMVTGAIASVKGVVLAASVEAGVAVRIFSAAASETISPAGASSIGASSAASAVAVAVMVIVTGGAPDVTVAVAVAEAVPGATAVASTVISMVIGSGGGGGGGGKGGG